MPVSEHQHETVLLNEAVAALQIKPEGVYIDGTYGRGGHSQMILEQLTESGHLLVMDKDPAAIAVAQQRFNGDSRTYIYSGSFARISDALAETGWGEPADGILLDLGVSSPQLDEAGRGFSFRRDGPLDMRMDPQQGMSAAEWLAQVKEDELVRVLFEFGEERYARRIARAILREQEKLAITRTQQLASIVAEAVPSREKGKDPATRTFQAIRIEINHELEDLKTCLNASVDLLAKGGRLVVISFHSLEDRIVKRFMREQSKGKQYPHDLPIRHVELGGHLKIVGKPVRASETEIVNNPRARSAIMRVAEKLS